MLIVDDRENPKIIQQVLARMGDANLSKTGQAKIQRMKSGDYIMGNTGIEAKEINDLYHSIMGHGRTRTIVAQLIELQETFEEPMLVVYNKKLKPMNRGRYLSGSQAVGEIAKMVAVIKKFKKELYSSFPKIRYMEFDSAKDFIDFLEFTNYQKTISGLTTPSARSNIVKKTSIDDRVSCLSAINGISIQNAENLLNHFGSIPKILASRRTQKQLMAVEGIGRQKAKRILSLRNKF